MRGPPSQAGSVGLASARPTLRTFQKQVVLGVFHIFMSSRDGTTMRKNPGLRTLAMISSLALTPLFAAGCGTVKTSGTTRTATEQLLLTNAWDSALQKVDFR